MRFLPILYSRTNFPAHFSGPTSVSSSALMVHPANQRLQSTSGLSRWIMILVAAQLVCGVGCVRRRLTVRTNPPGAQVFVDDQEIGTTPCSAGFVYYGTRKITIMKDGFKTETIFQKIPPPWYEFPGLDFLAENAYPREIRDERIVDVQLSPQELVPQQKLLDRGSALRDSARSGSITPMTAVLTAQPRPVEPPGFPGQGLPGAAPLPYEPLPNPGMQPRP